MNVFFNQPTPYNYFFWCQIISASSQAASRANGALSHGPVTEEGKARSSINNLQDGFYARKLTLMPDDDPALWATILDDHGESFQPEDPIEAGIVRKLAEGVFIIERWERRRADVELGAYHGQGKHYGLGIALADTPASTLAYENYCRWIERQSRANDRLHRQFLRHRKARRTAGTHPRQRRPRASKRNSRTRDHPGRAAAGAARTRHQWRGRPACLGSSTTYCGVSGNAQHALADPPGRSRLTGAGARLVDVGRDGGR